MKISFIGAGKVGTAFGKFINTNQQVVYYLSKSLDSAKKAATYVGCTYTEDLSDLIENSDVIFITTPDHQISKVVSEIIDLEKNLEHKVFVHMSGAHPSSLLNPLKASKAKVASIHPLQTFSNIEKASEDLKKAYFSYESEDEVLLPWLRSITDRVILLKPEDKVKYHLAACIYSNYLVTLMDFGNRMLSDLDLNFDGMTAMYPLIEATLNNLIQSGSKKALTGPIQRGDINTLERHLQALKDEDLNLYLSLAKATTNHLVEENDKREKLQKLWRNYE
ncbi:MAG: DUF2520 domain-containing protein [Clostridia bacterium]|nr:DUF2520 domain-containing protein [Clostridia bacterium]